MHKLRHFVTFNTVKPIKTETVFKEITKKKVFCPQMNFSPVSYESFLTNFTVYCLNCMIFTYWIMKELAGYVGCSGHVPNEPRIKQNGNSTSYFKVIYSSKY